MSVDSRHDTGTYAAELTIAPTPTSTQTSAKLLTEDVGMLRSAVKDLSSRSGDLHRSTQMTEWRARTAARGREAPTELLGVLDDLGFAWRDVAQMLGVSVPAVQKWRRGEKLTGENRRKLAGLVAACDQVADDYMVSEPASWFEMPIVDGAPVTPAMLYAEEQVDLVFDYASGHTDPESILSEFQPDWRENYRSRFESFVAADGNRSLRVKGD